jgi:hypothetical protein
MGGILVARIRKIDYNNEKQKPSLKRVRFSTRWYHLSTWILANIEALKRRLVKGGFCFLGETSRSLQLYLQPALQRCRRAEVTGN